jgi:hypothetical protein
LVRKIKGKMNKEDAKGYAGCLMVTLIEVVVVIILIAAYIGL